MYKKTATIVAWDKLGLASNHGIFDIALSEKRDKVYVNSFRSASVLVIDTKSDTYIKQIMFDIESFIWPGFSAITYSPLTDRIYNVSESLKKLFVLDAEEEKMIKAIDLPKAARGIKVDPKSGMIFLTHYGEGQFVEEPIVSLRIPDEMYRKASYFNLVSVLNKNEEKIKTLEVDWRPWELCVEPNGDRTYVSCKGKDVNRPGTLCVIDNKDLEVINHIKVGRKPRGVAVNHKHNKVYVACRYDNLVYVIDRKEGEVIGKIPVDCDCIGVVANPAVDKVYVINREGVKKLGDRYCGELTTLQIIDCKTDEVTNRLSFGKTGHYGALNSKTKRLYIPCEDSLDLWSIDLEKEEVLTKVDLGRSMDWHKLNPVTGYVYVTSHITDELSIIDGKNNKFIKALPMNGWPEKVAINTVKNRIYVCEEDRGIVSVVDGNTNDVIDKYDLGIGGHFNLGVPDGAHGGCVPDIAVDSQRNKVYVTCPAHDILAVIDENEKKVTQVYLGWAEKYGYPRWSMNIAVDEKRNLIYVINPLFGLLKIIDGNNYKIIDYIDLPVTNQNAVRTILDVEKNIIYINSYILKNRKHIGELPKKMGTIVKAFDPKNRRLYVLNGEDRLINIVDADTYKIVDTIKLERFTRQMEMVIDPTLNKIYVNPRPLINPELDIYERIEPKIN